MAILNVSVVCLSIKTTILPRNIVCDNIPFAIFFERSIRPRIPLWQAHIPVVSLIIVKAEVGTSKETGLGRLELGHRASC